MKPVQLIQLMDAADSDGENGRQVYRIERSGRQFGQNVTVPRWGVCGVCGSEVQVRVAVVLMSVSYCDRLISRASDDYTTHRTFINRL